MSNRIELNIQPDYPDGRPKAEWRIAARDQGVILRHNEGNIPYGPHGGYGGYGSPTFEEEKGGHWLKLLLRHDREVGGYGAWGIRNPVIFEENGVYHLFYDGAALAGARNCLAISRDLVHWERKGVSIEVGEPGKPDAGYTCSPWFFKEGDEWHMFYLSNDKLSLATPYLTFKAKGPSLAGPWIKQYDVVPFRTKPGTYFDASASPGHIIKHGGEYLQFFSGSWHRDPGRCMLRTLGIARTRDLNGSWTLDPDPLVPLEEQIENSSVYYEPANKTWFLFTNHIGLEEGKPEYTDAAWVYWSKDPNHWDVRNKAIVLDGGNCTWSKKVIGITTVVPVGNRLAMVYDGVAGISTSHFGRDIGLAWLDLPLVPPS